MYLLRLISRDFVSPVRGKSLFQETGPGATKVEDRWPGVYLSCRVTQWAQARVLTTCQSVLRSYGSS